MEQRTLGRTGIKVGRIGLGTATFGREIDEATAYQIMDYALEHGITLFDTAEAYGGGQAQIYRKNVYGVEDVREVSAELHSSEKIVGRWMKSRGTRNAVTILTKVTTNFTRDHVREALAASLERLQTDRADLYFCHSYHAATALEALEAMREAKAAGRIRAAGCSNYTGEQLEQAIAGGGRVFEAIENNYNVVTRDIETDVLPVTRRERIGVITYSPLGAGFLMGKYTPDRNALPKGTRFDVIPGHADVYFSERNFRWVGQLHEFAARVGVPVARLAMAWVLKNPEVDVMLAGARSVGHLENAVAAASLAFPDEWYAEIGAWT